MAFSAGFTPHPKISYAGAAPTGVASEAEYLEIGLQAPVADLNELRERLGAALPEGVDVLEAVEAGAGGLADRLEASLWRVEFANLTVNDLQPLVDGLLARAQLSVDRLTRDGRRTVDVRGPILDATVDVPPKAEHAIMEAVVRQVDACCSTRRHRRSVASCCRPRPRRSAVDLSSDACGAGAARRDRRCRRSARYRSFTASDVVAPPLDRARSSDQDFARAPRCARLHRLRAAAVTPMRRAPGGRTERPEPMLEPDNPERTAPASAPPTPTVKAPRARSRAKKAAGTAEAPESAPNDKSPESATQAPESAGTDGAPARTPRRRTARKAVAAAAAAETEATQAQSSRRRGRSGDVRRRRSLPKPARRLRPFPRPRPRLLRPLTSPRTRSTSSPRRWSRPASCSSHRLTHLSQPLGVDGERPKPQPKTVP